MSESDTQKLAALRWMLDLPESWPQRGLLVLGLIEHTDARGWGVLPVSVLRQYVDIGPNELAEDLAWLSRKGYLTYELDQGACQLNIPGAGAPVIATTDSAVSDRPGAC